MQREQQLEQQKMQLEQQRIQLQQQRILEKRCELQYEEQRRQREF